jgi:hypothetical protein
LTLKKCHTEERFARAIARYVEAIRSYRMAETKPERRAKKHEMAVTRKILVTMEKTFDGLHTDSPSSGIAELSRRLGAIFAQSFAMSGKLMDIDDANEGCADADADNEPDDLDDFDGVSGIDGAEGLEALT